MRKKAKQFLIVTWVATLLAILGCGPSKKEREQIHTATIVQKAYETRDPQAFLDLFYWEGVSDEERQKTVRIVKRGIDRNERVLRVFFDSTLTNAEFTDNGTTYRPNLPVVGVIQVVKYSESNPGHTATTVFSVGQKDGKLYIVGGAIPVK